MVNILRPLQSNFHNAFVGKAAIKQYVLFASCVEWNGKFNVAIVQHGQLRASSGNLNWFSADDALVINPIDLVLVILQTAQPTGFFPGFIEPFCKQIIFLERIFL